MFKQTKGDTPVRSHPLAAVAAVARRRASLRPMGLEAFFVAPAPGQAGGGSGVPAGPYWDAPSAFFAFRWAGGWLPGCCGSSAAYGRTQRITSPPPPHPQTTTSSQVRV